MTGGTTFGELESNFHDQAAGLVTGGADYLLVETCQDTRNVKAALLGIDPEEATQVAGDSRPDAPRVDPRDGG